MNVRALAALLVAAIAPAQQAGPEPREWPALQPEDVRDLRDQGRDLIEPAFLVRDDGELWVNPDPAAGAAVPGRYLAFGIPDLLRLEAPDGLSPMSWNTTSGSPECGRRSETWTLHAAPFPRTECTTST